VKAPEVPELRVDGKRHALRRTAHGIVVVSEERGVLGFVRSPWRREIQAACLVEDDAVLLVARDALARAATPDDAVAAKVEDLEPLDRAATLFACGGRVAVAAVPSANGAFYVSRDGGRHFKAEKRPAPGALLDVTVRSDEVIVAATEKERVKNEQGKDGVRAQVLTQRGAGGWSKGPFADAFYGPVLTHQGDSIIVQSPGKKQLETLGLDAKGRWIPTDFPDTWLPFGWTDTRVAIDVPPVRPGFPKPAKGGYGMIGALGRGGGEPCQGVMCLMGRDLLGTAPSVSAFHDGVCDGQHVKEHKETFPVLDPGGKALKEESYTTYSCDERGPAKRASTLVVPTEAHPIVARLPASCASGRVVGTLRASFVYCTSEHRGRPSILYVSPSGTLAEVASGMAGDLEILGAESASDGTTVLFADKADWVCTSALPCAPVPRPGFLAARPLPGGRALVAREGASDEELIVELFGEPGAQAVKVAVTGKVLEIEVTTEGAVRLWTSPSQTRRGAPADYAREKKAPPIDAFLVRADGGLVADAAAKEGWLREIAAARAAPGR
jgi:hypothetical protein